MIRLGVLIRFRLSLGRQDGLVFGGCIRAACRSCRFSLRAIACRLGLARGTSFDWGCPHLGKPVIPLDRFARGASVLGSCGRLFRRIHCGLFATAKTHHAFQSVEPALVLCGSGFILGRMFF